MPAHNAPGLGLRVGYDVGEDGWGPAYNEDMRKLSALVQPVVFSFVSSLPDSPTDGDRHILSAEDSNSGALGSIILFDVDEWVYIAPSEGWEVWDIGTAAKYRYTGGAWVVIPGSGTLTANDVGYDSGDEGDSNSTETTVAGALDDLYFRVRALGGEDLPLDPAFFFPAGSEGQTVLYVATRPFDLPINLTGSVGYAVVPTTDDSNSDAVVFDIQKNGASIGSATWDGASNTPVFTFASGQSFAAGDRLGIVAPAAFDGGEGFAFTLLGTRTG